MGHLTYQEQDSPAGCRLSQDHKYAFCRLVRMLDIRGITSSIMTSQSYLLQDSLET